MAKESAAKGDYYAAINGSVMAKTLLYAAEEIRKALKLRLPLDDSA